MISKDNKFYMGLFSEIFRNLFVRTHGYQFQSFFGVLCFKQIPMYQPVERYRPSCFVFFSALLWFQRTNPFPYPFSFFAPLAKGQRAIVMALCPSCLRLSVRPSVRACVRKLFLQKTRPQKQLTGFLRNFTGMFLRCSSFKFLQIILFYEEFWLPWRSK